MSKKKPPPRPPLPRLSTAKSGQPTGVAPERSLRNAFASISIRYSNSTKDSDSEEEISIVRKEKAKVPDQNTEGEKRESIEEEEGFKVLRKVCDADETLPPCRPEESILVETNKNPSETTLKVVKKSFSSQELRETPEKKAVTKQSTWPSYSRADDVDATGIMKFLRGRERERDQENDAKSTLSKENLSLSERELKEETDSGSFPSKAHFDSSSESYLKANEKRPRSPSPFRLLARDRQSESANAGDHEKPRTTAGVSLSSLLASMGKEEAHSEAEAKISDTEEIESTPEVLLETPDPSSLELSLNFCHDHFDQEPGLGIGSGETRTRLLSRLVTDKSPQFENFSLCCLMAYIYFITEWPPFIYGVVFGALFAYLAGCAFLWLFCPEDTVAERYEKELLEFEERKVRAPKPIYQSVDPGLLLKRRKQEASIYLI